MSKSNAVKPDKPAKPYEGFPLFPHATGRWCKKIRGKFHYFGPWSDAAAAEAKFNEERDDLYAGRTPQPKTDALTVQALVNEFLNAKRRRVDNHELAACTWADYDKTCAKVVKVFGRSAVVAQLHSKDFVRLRSELEKGRGPVALGNDIQRVRVLFKYAYDADLIANAVKYGVEFKRPSKTVLRKARAEKGERLFEPEQVKAIIDKATIPLKAMILLGVNCGLGNHDVGALPIKALNLDAGWLNYPRPKTGMARRCPLWPETVAALRSAIASRPAPTDAKHNGLVFVTKYGKPWLKGAALVESKDKKGVFKASTDNPVAKAFAKVMQALSFNRPGLSFYALRHTFATIGGESGDQIAVNAIMGHAPHGSDMSAVYRERITDARLQAVVAHVRQWSGLSNIQSSPSAASTSPDAEPA